ncbi:MAG: hypothetical protein HKN23_14630 [Verrucomicrobiales bacterium]|nr:hypothetical protein [Verrucomicrobiales bacterium]
MKRSKNYGSKHLNGKELDVAEVQIKSDGKSIALKIPDLKPTWGMSIQMKLKSPDGEEFERLIHNSIFELGE